MKLTSSAVLFAVLLSVTATSAAENPLVAAVKAGKKDTVRALLKKPANVNTPTADGATAIHWAALGNDVELLDLLIAAGADVNIVNRYGVRPLGLAAEQGKVANVERLLKAGANPEATTSTEGQTVLMTAARSGQLPIVRALLANRANPNARESWLGQTALMWAAAENHAEIVEALLDAGADPSVLSNLYEDADRRPIENATVPPQWVSKGGMTALHFAARQGAIDAVRVLADKRADLEQEDPDGMTALLYAAFNGHFDTAVLLLEKGANPNHYNQSGESVLFLSVDLNIIEDDGAAIGVRGGRPKTLDGNKAQPIDVAKLAIAKGAELNPRISKRLRRRVVNFGIAPDAVAIGSTPLWRAARAVDLDFVKLFMEAGADPKIESNDGRTTLMAAAGPELANYFGDKFIAIGTEGNRVAVLTLLLDAGVDVNKANKRGETPLHYAVTTGQPAVVKLLLDRGARLDAKDVDNRVPLDVAMGIDRRTRNQLWVPLPVHEPIVAMLREAMQAKGIPIEPYTAPRPLEKDDPNYIRGRAVPDQ